MIAPRTMGKQRKTREAPPVSADVDSVVEELRHGGDREDIVKKCTTIGDYLRALNLPDDYWGYIEIGRGPKKNFAQRFSASLAQKIANALRGTFDGIYPDASGRWHESTSRGAGGKKKLDVNYSTREAGLGLAVSVKTVNFKDEKTRRYTKNVKRADGELRAEAQDVHDFHPNAVLAAVVLMPADAASDSADGRSSLKHAWDVFRRRSGRTSKKDDASLFELVYLGVYESTGESAGTVTMFDVAQEMPDRGLPPKLLRFGEVIEAVAAFYSERNER